MCQLSRETIDGILAAGRIYEVGGAVRDRFIPGRTVKDRDYLVTGVPYDRLTRILKAYGRVDLVGRSFGVIKFTQHRKERSYTFDIALPRREYSTGLGHKDFAVEFDPDIRVEDDLTRRDFTINAMAIALDTDDLIDPLGGKLDLDNRTLRMTSPESFTEDPLRMLRAVQFAARFEFEIEAQTLAAIRQNVGLIATVSQERIAEELNKLLLLAGKPSDGFRLMQTLGLLRYILPELEACVGVDQPGGFHAYDVFEHTLRCIDAAPAKLNLRWAALFHDINKPQSRRLTGDGATFYGHESMGARTAGKALRRLRYGKDLIEEVVTLVDRHMFTTDVTDKGMRRLIRRVGQELIFDLLDLRRADVVAQGKGGTTEDVDEFEQQIRDEIDRKPPFSLSDLVLDGRDVMKRYDIPPSKTVGRILDYLMEQVLDNPENNTTETLTVLADAYYKKFGASEDTESKEESDE
jgi:putative nucleotidyltransferase with HDIG domain